MIEAGGHRPLPHGDLRNGRHGCGCAPNAALSPRASPAASRGACMHCRRCRWDAASISRGSTGCSAASPKQATARGRPAEPARRRGDLPDLRSRRPRDARRAAAEVAYAAIAAHRDAELRALPRQLLDRGVSRRRRSRGRGIWDDDAARGREAAARFGVPFEPDTRRARSPAATPSPSAPKLLRHPDLTERSGAAGRAILCEKPTARTVAEADAMAEIVREAGVRSCRAFRSASIRPHTR